MAGFVTVLCVLLGLANLPFVSSRFLGVFSVRGSKQGRLLTAEVLVCFVLSLGLAILVERFVEGVSYRQGWEFYTVLACLFVVLGFPGFVRRFFWTVPT